MQVFISYASEDRSVAEQVRAALEGKGIRCWIAPRDIRPGQTYAQAIVTGIKNARAMVVIFSTAANESDNVVAEVDRAFQREIPIIPFRLENLEPGEKLEYYLSTRQWMDAWEGPFEQRVAELADSVQNLLGGAPQPAVSTPRQPEPSGRWLWQLRRRRYQAYVAGGAMVALAFGGIQLVSWYRERSAIQKALEGFSITRPQPNEEIPLPERGVGVVQGKFPVLQGAREPSVTVEVYRLPRKEKVPQDMNRARVDLVNGRWEYDARFGGEGPHEVVARASVQGMTAVRPVQMNCVKRLDFLKRVMAGQDVAPEVRGAAQRLSEDQWRCLRQMQAGQWGEALKTIGRTLESLEALLQRYPEERFLQNTLGYMLKNRAIVMQALGRRKEFEESLRLAEKTFAAVRDQAPEDAAAWDGLGNVYLLQGDARRALVHIERALELDPNYEAAKHDRELAEKLLKPPGG